MYSWPKSTKSTSPSRRSALHQECATYEYLLTMGKDALGLVGRLRDPAGGPLSVYSANASSLLSFASSSVVPSGSVGNSSFHRTLACRVNSSSMLLCRLICDRPRPSNLSPLSGSLTSIRHFFPLRNLASPFCCSRAYVGGDCSACWGEATRRSPSVMTLSTFMRFAMKRILGQQLFCPAESMHRNRAGLGSLRIFQKSLRMVFGQIVIVPLKRWSQISLQSWPSGRGSNSRCRRILRYFCRSSLMDVSRVEPRNPPRQPRPRRWVTGRPGDPRGEKKKRLMCGFTWDTMLKLTLKCKLRALRGMSVRSEPSFHLLPKD
jgi:hypothetical protein